MQIDRFAVAKAVSTPETRIPWPPTTEKSGLRAKFFGFVHSLLGPGLTLHGKKGAFLDMRRYADARRLRYCQSVLPAWARAAARHSVGGPRA